MAGSSNDDYVFPRHYRSRARLNLQYYLWQETPTLTNYIHPHITLPTTDRALEIADVATGSGYPFSLPPPHTSSIDEISMWATSLATSTSHRITATNLSPTLFPPPAWTPPNVTLRTQDLFAPPPEEMTGRFDLVHLRLMLFSIADDEQARKVLENLVKMVRKGGWVQWEEYDMPSARIVKADESVEDGAVRKLVGAFVGDGRFAPTWPSHLDQIMNDRGLVDVHKEIHKPAPEQYGAVTDCALMGFEEVMEKLADRGRAREMMGLLPGAAEEVERGVAFVQPRVVCVGRKVV